MIDLPTPVYIEYKNLSPISTQAEFQKDFIALVLNKNEGQSKIISELSDGALSQDSNDMVTHWEVKCLSCPAFSPQESTLIENSLKKKSPHHSNSHEIAFDTRTNLGKISSWRVQITEVKPLVVHSGDEVRVNFNSLNGIAIQSIGKSQKNAALGETIPVKVDNWFNKMNNSNSTKVIEAKVISAQEVEYVSK